MNKPIHLPSLVAEEAARYAADYDEQFKYNNVHDQFIAYLGNGDGSTVTAPDVQPPNTHVYYYTEQGTSVNTGVARLETPKIPYGQVSAYHGTPILIGKLPRRLNKPGECVLDIAGPAGEWVIGGGSITNQIINNYIYPQVSSLRFIRSEVTSPTSLGVTVVGPWPFRNRNSGVRSIYQTQTITTAIEDAVAALTAGQHQIAIVAVDIAADPETAGSDILVLLPGEVGTSGSALPNRSAFTISDVALINAAGYAPSSVIYLYYGQTAITEDDILRTFEIREGLGYPPLVDITPTPAGEFTNARIRVDSAGRVIFAESGTSGGGSGTTLVQYSASTTTRVNRSDAHVPNLPFDIADADPGGDGAYTTYFSFTPPVDGLYTIHLHLELDGHHAPGDAFCVTGGTNYPGYLFYADYWVPDGATRGPDLLDQTTTLHMTAGLVMEPIAIVGPGPWSPMVPDYVNLNSSSGDPFAQRSYIEISWKSSPVYGEQAAHNVLAGPVSGPPAAPLFRRPVTGDVQLSIQTVTANYSIVETDDVIFTSGSSSITLSLPTGAPVGKRLTIVAATFPGETSVMPYGLSGYVEGGGFAAPVVLRNDSLLADTCVAVLVYQGSDIWAFENGNVYEDSSVFYWSSRATVKNGGTGVSSFTAKGLIYSNDVNTLGSLVGTSAGQVARWNGTNWAAAALDTGDIGSGVLSVARGGSGVGTLTGILLGNGTSAFSGISGTSGKFIRHNGTNWTADTIVAADLPNHSAALLTSGTVGLARGGTNADLSATGPGFLKQATSGSAVTVSTLAAGDIPSLDMSKITTGTLSVGQGGTGATTLTGILLGNGTSAVTAISGTSGKFIRHNGTNWVADTIAAGDLPNHSAGLLTSGSISLGAGSTISVGGNTGLPSTGNVALFSGSSSGGLINMVIENYVATANNNATSLDFILGSGFSPTARIMANLDNAGTAATSLRFLTYNSGLSEKVRIQSDGSFGIGATSPSSLLHTLKSDSVTNAVTVIDTIEHRSTGTPANGFGLGIDFLLQTSTTTAQNAARLVASWNDATHATYKGDLIAYVYDAAGTGTPTARELWRGRGSGSAAQWAMFGGTPVGRQTSGADLTNNVASGGTNDQIDNWTNLTTYATDAAAIRNAIYQLARKVKQLNDGLRLYNLFT